MVGCGAPPEKGTESKASSSEATKASPENVAPNPSQGTPNVTQHDRTALLQRPAAGSGSPGPRGRFRARRATLARTMTCARMFSVLGVAACALLAGGPLTEALAEEPPCDRYETEYALAANFKLA